MVIYYDLCSVLRERDDKYFLHNFNKSECIAMIFGKQHCKYTGKLSVKQMSTLSKQCCYFTLQNEKALYTTSQCQNEYFKFH